MATAPSPNDLTRQQLDELDALLQRMLSVPLSPVDTPMPAGAPTLPTPPLPTPPVPITSWRVDPPAPTAVSSPHIEIPDPPAPVSLKYEAPRHATPQVAAPAPPPQVAPPKPPKTAAPQAAPAPQAQPRPTPPLPAPAPKPAVQITPAPVAPPVPFLLWPLVWLNSLFNFACGLFGFPGRVLRSGFFKFLYGLVGIALLAYTGAHVAQEKGWLSLPVTLPWPPSH